MEEFKVNEYITLKQDSYGTIIYVGGHYFVQCTLLILNFPGDKVRSFDNVNSIDDAVDKVGLGDLGNMEYYRREYISVEEEFWGYCSNMQVWCEYGYDTKLLHRNLAFPLLKKLTEIGDPIAKEVFAKEILERFQSGHESVVNFLMLEEFLQFVVKKPDWQRSILETIFNFDPDKILNESWKKLEDLWWWDIDTGRVKNILEDALKKNQKNKWIFYFLGLNQEIQFGLEKSREYYQRALDIDPHFVPSLIKLGKIYIITKNIALLKEISDKILSREIWYDWQIWIDDNECDWETGSYQKDYMYYYYFRGVYKYFQKDYKNALKDLLYAKSLGLENYYLFLLICEIHHQLGDYDSAMKQYEDFEYYIREGSFKFEGFFKELSEKFENFLKAKDLMSEEE